MGTSGDSDLKLSTRERRRRRCGKDERNPETVDAQQHFRRAAHRALRRGGLFRRHRQLFLLHHEHGPQVPGHRGPALFQQCHDPERIPPDGQRLCEHLRRQGPPGAPDHQPHRQYRPIHQRPDPPRLLSRHPRRHRRHRAAAADPLDRYRPGYGGADHVGVHAGGEPERHPAGRHPHGDLPEPL